MSQLDGHYALIRGLLKHNKFILRLINKFWYFKEEIIFIFGSGSRILVEIIFLILDSYLKKCKFFLP